jgi:FkbM family methyltransferase
MAISRKGFLAGIGCAGAGAALGAVAGRQLVPVPPPAPSGRYLKIPPRGVDSFSQAGEDRIVSFICRYLGITPIDYIDVGAHDPVDGNNTYLFYLQRHRGVLIEPNGEMCRKLREVRPDDQVLAAGIGATAAREADYYVMTESSWNTFSKDEAERQAKVSDGRYTIEKVVKVPLLELNQVMEEHFHRAPAFVSVDTQGLELAILKSIDYGRFRPKIICAETLVTGTRRTTPEIVAFMEKQAYSVCGMTFVNTLFVDSQII